MEDIIENIANRHDLDLFSYFIKPRAGRDGVRIFQLIEALLIHKSSVPAMESLGYSPQTFNRNIKKLFPNIKLNGGGETWGYYLLSGSDYKYCGSCKTNKPKKEFTTDTHRSGSLSFNCRDCNRSINKNWYNANKEYHVQYLNDNRAKFSHNNAKRRAIKTAAIPPWANLEKIKNIYLNCPDGYHVDHIVPLQGKYICGLHIETNLQYLTVEENLTKGNRFNYWWEE